MSPTHEVGALTRFAPAKINLALHVVGRRADGYHLLDSLVAFASTGDRITVEPAAEDAFTVSGPYAAGVPVDAGNLVLRARDALRKEIGQSAFPVRIHLEKTLPIASGIGGGSSDAAATLKALCALWKADLPSTDLAALGLSLGADVPMCLYARPARIRGIGEEIAPIGTLPDCPIVLVNPGIAVSTPAIFKQLTTRDNPPLAIPPETNAPQAWLDWLHATRNDLQPHAIAVAPIISEALRALTNTGASFARMSGSGATCFGVFATEAQAEAAAAQLLLDDPQWYVQATMLKGSDSAP
ncbi:4-(cytidine 5'-diphospho)-2-C-methyl-D-erythritol kinase [Tianweitania sp. BSSL-BM11]|uniref:4-diphosphocytidyl-2-C-methyl-D-erythritol kinase n=1 Tax=Tianweitania aestuarii TaxID=2814886 RepID=A0ABS5RRV0_9HYPH|nr:4-(cytidine 5'-diphospho)-2-C-methyl-D-erythritol kinase [Tianweitania aestuarii]MBS9719741.1 4-(cytidine 5'-diphospho)-2-C-methyl-D-erythritol kinase [Tianweitania aestuarii]